MNIRYRKITPADFSKTLQLVLSLYQEDPGEPMTERKILRTFDELQKYPEKGSVLIFEDDDHIMGYAILINFWSNEWGGNVLHIDELYVLPEFRNQGIASEFIGHLKETKFSDAVALQLEVTPVNEKARKLYEKLGFSLHKNNAMMIQLAKNFQE